MATWPPATHQDAVDQIDSKALTLLATSTALGNVDFTSIPSTYRSLQIIVHGRTNRATEYDSERMTFNGDTATNYEFQVASWTGTAADTPAQFLAFGFIEVGTLPASTALASASGQSRILITNYADTNLYKNVLVEYAARGTSNLRRGITTGVWRSTAAINRVQLAHLGTPVTGSAVSLYGMT